MKESHSNSNAWIIVIGASAGGDRALEQTLAGLSESIHACILVVRHLSKKSSAGYLARKLSRVTSLKCMQSRDDIPLEPGHVYIATADKHLLVDEDHAWQLRGARENRWRPSIDVLFRSAAVAYENKVIGVVLSGYLDDGTAGLSAIKRCGGIAIV